jgi:hypothetical protein
MQNKKAAADASRLILQKGLSGLTSAATSIQPINSRTFDLISPCFINDSPTRMALAPHFFNRFTSARV